MLLIGKVNVLLILDYIILEVRGVVSLLSVVVSFKILWPVLAVHENTLKSLITVHGQLNWFLTK